MYAEIYKPNYGIILTYCWVTFQSTMINLQFVFAALVLRERFKILNEGLIESFTVNVGPSKALRSFYLDAMMQMHDRLCDGIYLLNSTFTTQLIPFTTYFLLQITSSFHFNIIEVFYKKRFDFGMFFLNGYWMVFFITIMSHSLHAGATTTEEASKTSSIVHKIINKSTDLFGIEKVLFSYYVITFTCQ